MGKLILCHDSRSIEEMLKFIAGRNQIKRLELVIYTQYPADSDASLEEALSSEIREKIIIDDRKIPYISRISRIERDRNEVVGISSKVIYGNNLEGHLKHLDMDLICEEDIDVVQEFLESMHPKGENYEGFLVFSGNGYHYHGADVLRPEAWVDWMKRASIPDKLTDYDVDTLVSPRWCEIQLEKGFSILRLTSSKLKPEGPKLLYSVFKNERY
jgi:hypothetical protein